MAGLNSPADNVASIDPPCTPARVRLFSPPLTRELRMPHQDNPLIVQSDMSLLLEVHSPRYEATRDVLARFAELVKSPEHIHTYRITPLSLWNAAASGMNVRQIREVLRQYSKYDVPDSVLAEVRTQMSRYGKLRLLPSESPDVLVLEVEDDLLAQEVASNRKLGQLLRPTEESLRFEVQIYNRGNLKQAMARLGYPVADLVGFTPGEPLEVNLRKETLTGEAFGLRPYQKEAVDVFHAGGGPDGGHGVVVLPCGAGKTMVGLGAMARSGVSTLILVTSVAAVRQWIREILDKTELTPEEIGEYTGELKEVKPVTVATYQILTHRRRKEDDFCHFSVFVARDWGLILYDEVHLLPAPVFRITASLQARRRLGLTATLVREDGLEHDVFALVGPKRYDVPWRQLERQGYIASAVCCELRVPMERSIRIEYATAEERRKFRHAAENPAKVSVVAQLCEQHRRDHVLVIGQYLTQLRALSSKLGAPIITGHTPTAERERLYRSFREGEIRLLVVSKVANFAIDLPDANVLVQVSGTFGSRQEEAQRLGRILRPKDGQAKFYSLVSTDTCEQEFGLKRQLFLTEQGYRYTIEDLCPAAPEQESEGDGIGEFTSEPGAG